MQEEENYPPSLRIRPGPFATGAIGQAGLDRAVIDAECTILNLMNARLQTALPVTN